MMMDEVQVGEENTAHIRRQLVFQGLSVKQKETQFNVDRAVGAGSASTLSISSTNKASAKPRRALGDISNNKGSCQFRDFDDTPHQERQTKRHEASKSKESIAKLASQFPMLMKKPRSDEDIEIAYGGLSSKRDNDMNINELQAQIDAEILSWQQEVDAALAIEKAVDDLDDLNTELPPIHLDHDEIPQPNFLVDNDSIDIPPLFDGKELEFEIKE
ncbi:hypothetical protein H310_01415 [Aphanomyces invadans]|uniref:Uncharacterized protein n=1 Tax=Aphanomyces invadans TaxID=157072 RepID=A0A024UTJ2_9STRA|nr:hypothetical protein H310_01415 [Aphanomyces invadans]ETW08933.1 hypothetical protein H310_01415 [Aphanomyces invadans]|eukprot:XP_008862738.1 hypothetical protein H310_01415 [Aphanomyces invadans]